MISFRQFKYSADAGLTGVDGLRQRHRGRRDMRRAAGRPGQVERRSAGDALAALDQIGAQRRGRTVVVRRRHKPQQIRPIERDRGRRRRRTQRRPAAAAIGRVLPSALGRINRVAADRNPGEAVGR